GPLNGHCCCGIEDEVTKAVVAVQPYHCAAIDVDGDVGLRVCDLALNPVDIFTNLAQPVRSIATAFCVHQFLCQKRRIICGHLGVLEHVGNKRGKLVGCNKIGHESLRSKILATTLKKD